MELRLENQALTINFNLHFRTTSILSFRRRIYFMRKRRNEFVQQLLQKDETFKVFYPIDIQQGEFRTYKTSRIYVVALATLGLLTTLSNFLIGFMH